jgi:hypothetical protein
MNFKLFTTVACVAAMTVSLSPMAAYAQAVPDASAAANAGAQSGSVSGALNNNSTTNGPQTTTVAPVSNGDSTAISGSNSGASANQNQAQFNGGNTVGPIDSSVRVGPTTSTSDSNSGSFSGSNSVSRGGNATGGAGGAGGTGTSSATTGPATATTGASTSSAQGGSGGSSNATGGNSTSTANPNATNEGNAQNITFNNVAPNKTKLETVPQVYAPALSTTLTETCMGSTSGGISVMGFGGTLGTTWNDAQCVRRLNAREMAQTLGDRDAARALMCQDKDVAAAYLAVGQDCRAKWVQQVAVAPPPPTPPMIINVPAAPAPVVQMAPIPNPQVIYRDRPRAAHRSTHKNVPACKVDPHYSCPAHDDEDYAVSRLLHPPPCGGRPRGPDPR